MGEERIGEDVEKGRFGDEVLSCLLEHPGNYCLYGQVATCPATAQNTRETNFPNPQNTRVISIRKDKLRHLLPHRKICGLRFFYSLNTND